MIYINTENSKTNEPRKFALNLSQRLSLRSWNKHVDFQNVSVYHSWRCIRQQYQNNKLKMVTPAGNDEFELLYGSHSVSKLYRLHHKEA